MPLAEIGCSRHPQLPPSTSSPDVFWNDAVLEEAMLTQPHLSDLARSLGLPGHVLDLDEFTSAYLDTDREGTYA